jgi:hypothetical protein
MSSRHHCRPSVGRRANAHTPDVHSKTPDEDVVQALYFLLGFFTGYFSGFGAWYAELFPTSVRSTAAGFCFNFGRVGAIAGIKHGAYADPGSRLHADLLHGLNYLLVRGGVGVRIA